MFSGFEDTSQPHCNLICNVESKSAVMMGFYGFDLKLDML